MTLPVRSFLALSILVIILAACGTATGAPGADDPTPSQPASPTVEPTAEPTAEPTEEPTAEPTEEPAEEREVDGTITVAEGMVPSGPGGTIAEAIAAGPSGDLPTLVNGVLFRDVDGRIFLATGLADAEAPTFDGPMLEVIGMDADGPNFDMANAELLGLEEANGIVFVRNSQVLGFIELP